MYSSIKNYMRKNLESQVVMFLFLLTILTLPSVIDPIVFPRFLLASAFSCYLLFILPWRLIYIRIKASKYLRFCALLIFLYFISLILNTFVKRDFGLSLFGAYGRNLGLIHYLSMLTLFIFGLYLQMNSRSFLRTLLSYIYYSTLPICFLGLAQYFGLRHYDYVNPYNPIIGTFANPNYLSQYLAIASISTFHRWSIAQNRFYSSITGILLVLTMFLNQSVQGPLVLILTVLTAIFVRKVTSIVWQVLAIVLIPLVLFLTIYARGSWASLNPVSDEISFEFRRNYIIGALRMFLESPIFGTGIDNFGNSYIAVRDANMASSGIGAADNAHNLLFQILATQGIFATLLVTLLITISVYNALRLIRNTNTRSEYFSLALLVNTATLSSMISIESQPFSAIFWITLGLLSSVVGTVNQRGALPSVISKTSSRSFNRFHVLVCKYLTLFILVITISSLLIRWQDYRILSSLYSYKRPSAIEVLDTLRNREGSWLPRSVWLRDSDLLYEISVAATQNTQESKTTLEDCLDLVNFGLKSNPDHLGLLSLKSYILSELGLYREAHEIRLNLRALDPFNSYNNSEIDRLNFFIK